MSDGTARLMMFADDDESEHMTVADRELLRKAAKALEVLEYLDQRPAWIESGPTQCGETCVVVNSFEFTAGSHLDCLVEAHKSLVELVSK